MFILGCLYDSYKQKTRVGRRGLSERALERDIYLTENQIRKLLFQMESSGLVRMLYGRGGTTITPFGIETLNSWRANLQ